MLALELALQIFAILNCEFSNSNFSLKYFQLQVQWRLWPGCAAQERDAGVDGDPEGLAQRAQEEPLPHQGGEDHAGHHHKDDSDAGKQEGAIWFWEEEKIQIFRIFFFKI